MDKLAILPLIPLALGAASLYGAYKQAPTLRRDISSGNWRDAATGTIGLGLSLAGARFGFGGSAGRWLAKGVPKLLGRAGAPGLAKGYAAAASVPRAIGYRMAAGTNRVMRPWTRASMAARQVAPGLRAQAVSHARAGRIGQALGTAGRAIAPSIKSLPPRTTAFVGAGYASRAIGQTAPPQQTVYMGQGQPGYNFYSHPGSPAPGGATAPGGALAPIPQTGPASLFGSAQARGLRPWG